MQANRHVPLLIFVMLLCSTAGLDAQRSPSKALSRNFVKLAEAALILVSSEDDQTSNSDIRYDLSVFLAAQRGVRLEGDFAFFDNLSGFGKAKALNMVDRIDTIQSALNSWQKSHPNAKDEDTQNAKVAIRNTVLDQPAIRQMHEKEIACSAELLEMLMNRRYHSPSNCKNVRPLSQ